MLFHDRTITGNLETSCFAFGQIRQTRRRENPANIGISVAGCGVLIVEAEKTMREITIGTYRHFKGNLYSVLDFAEHTETGEMMVVYQAE